MILQSRTPWGPASKKERFAALIISTSGKNHLLDGAGMVVKLVIVNDDSPKWFTEKLVSDYRLSGTRRPATFLLLSASGGLAQLPDP
jgi:hypothetical protein